MFALGFAACVAVVAFYFWLQGWFRRRRAQRYTSYAMLCHAERHLHELMDAPSFILQKQLRLDDYSSQYHCLRRTIADLGCELGYTKREQEQAVETLDSIRCSGCAQPMFKRGQLVTPFCAVIPTRKRAVDTTDLKADPGVQLGGRIISVFESATVCSRACADKVIATWPRRIGPEAVENVIESAVMESLAEHRYGDDVILLQQGHCNLAKLLNEP